MLASLLWVGTLFLIKICSNMAQTCKLQHISHSSYDDCKVYVMSTKWCCGRILRWLSIASLRFLIRWPGVSRSVRLYNSNRVGGWAVARVGIVEADQRPIPRKQSHRRFEPAIYRSHLVWLSHGWLIHPWPPVCAGVSWSLFVLAYVTSYSMMTGWGDSIDWLAIVRERVTEYKGFD